MRKVDTVIGASIKGNPLLKTLVERANKILGRTIAPALDVVRIGWSSVVGPSSGRGLKVTLIGRRKRLEITLRYEDVAQPHRLWDICERLWCALRDRERERIPA